MDNLKFCETIWLNTKDNVELSSLIMTPTDQLSEDQMIDLILRIDSCYEQHSLISWFQDDPREFFVEQDRLKWLTPYQLLQNDPLWWVDILSNFYNLNQIIIDD